VFTDGNISSTLQQLYTGATVASSFLCWGFLYLSVFPQIQEEVLKEIDDVVGKYFMFMKYSSSLSLAENS